MRVYLDSDHTEGRSPRELVKNVEAWARASPLHRRSSGERREPCSLDSSESEVSISRAKLGMSTLSRAGRSSRFVPIDDRPKGLEWDWARESRRVAKRIH